MGPAMSQESAGASRRVDPVEELAVCRDTGESASALENAGESGACSNVANGPTAAELLELIYAASIALDAQLQALAEAVRAKCHAGDLKKKNGVPASSLCHEPGQLSLPVGPSPHVPRDAVKLLDHGGRLRKRVGKNRNT